jgi:hypothetical protein
MTITEYLETVFDHREDLLGFTIGKGKKLYWYITPMPKFGRYRCLPVEDGQDSLGWPRTVLPTQEVTPHYKTQGTT